MPVSARETLQQLAGPVQLRSLAMKAIRAGAVTSIAGTGSYLAILATTAVFASTSSDAAEIRSVLLPCTLLCAGLSMMFSVPAQIGGARGNRYPGGANGRRWLKAAGLIALAFVGLYTAVRAAILPLESVFFGGLDDPSAASSFLAAMVLAYLFVALSDFIEGHLRGRGKFLAASILVLARAAAISGSYVVALYGTDLNPDLLPYFYLASGVSTTVIGAVLVVKDARVARSSESQALPPTGRLILTVGAPVFASYMLLSAVVSVQIIAVQAGLGQSGQIAFSGMLFIQTLCVVAATGIAAGASSVVVADALVLNLSRVQVGRVVSRIGNYIGLLELIPLVLFVAFGFWALPAVLVGVEVLEPFVLGSYLMFIAALLTANCVMIVTILEELGFAAFGFLLNCIYFVLLIAVTYGASSGFGSFTAVGAGLAALSLLAFCILRVLLLRLPKGSVF